MSRTKHSGLELSFLEYFDVTPENQKRIQQIYVPFFEGRNRVVDLGCGTGDFLDLLREAGVRALGVDSDPACCDRVRSRGLDVVQEDVVTYLERSDSESVDAFFSAHLVEHLAFESLLKMFEQCYRVLRPGGRIAIVTPNVHSLYAHLDLFHLHFGHVGFYHQELLGFLLEDVGFVDVALGENETYLHPLLGEALVRDASQVLEDSCRPLDLPGVQPRPKNPLGRCWWHLKALWIRVMVQPYIDVLRGELAQLARSYQALVERHNLLIDRIDRPFEAFVVADKP